MTVILDDIADVAGGRSTTAASCASGRTASCTSPSGNAEDEANCQNPKKPNGKVLRLNPDGSIPSDNPIAGSPVYALRLPQPVRAGVPPEHRPGLDHREQRRQRRRDQRARSRRQLRLPDLRGVRQRPEVTWTRSGSPAPRPSARPALTFYTGDQLPQFRGDLFFCAFNTGELTRLRLGGPDFDRTVGGRRGGRARLPPGRGERPGRRPLLRRRSARSSASAGERGVLGHRDRGDRGTVHPLTPVPGTHRPRWHGSCA